MQQLVASAGSDADAAREDVRAGIGHLGDRRSVLVVDETGFLKKGRKSAGVQWHSSGGDGGPRRELPGWRLSRVCAQGGATRSSTARALAAREVVRRSGALLEGRHLVRDAGPHEGRARTADPGAGPRRRRPGEPCDRRKGLWRRPATPHAAQAARAALCACHQRHRAAVVRGVLGRLQPCADAIAAALPAAARRALSTGAGSKGPREYR